jgi:hypothetical protein
MATFYVLPSRHQFGQRLGDLLSSVFPGTRYTPWDWPELAESLAALIEDRSDAFIVFSEDLDDQLSVKDAVDRDFGAVSGDAILEIDLGATVYPLHIAGAA